MSLAIGSKEWIERGGSLTLGEKWAITLGGVRKQMSLRASRRRKQRCVLDQLDANALESIAPPLDLLAQISSGAAARLQPQWLTNHGWRTYAWGALLALKADLKYDRGLLFAACQLHDLGLTPHAAHPDTECFTLRSARLARSVLKEARASAEEISRVEEAIILHVNLEVRIEQGVEAHLLHAGAGLDLVGLRFNEVPPTLRGAVLEKYPRPGFNGHICRCMSHEAKAAPNSRAGLFVRRLGFLDLVAAAPFDD